jgi:hypothetical protein
MSGTSTLLAKEAGAASKRKAGAFVGGIVIAIGVKGELVSLVSYVMLLPSSALKLLSPIDTLSAESEALTVALSDSSASQAVAKSVERREVEDFRRGGMRRRIVS